MTSKAGILFLLSATLLGPAASRAACSLESKATVSLQISGGTIIVPVDVNGITATFILDTGAQRSMVTGQAVQRLKLARDPWVDTTMKGIGGIERRPNVNPHSLTLGGAPLVRHTLNHDTSLTVGVLPGALGSHIDGLLGRDFLSPFDLDLDMPNGRLTLYQIRNCSGRFLPWVNGYDALPVTYTIEHALVVPVTLDGRPLRALLDTGASASLLAAPGMFRLGLQLADFAADPTDEVSGLGSRLVTMHRHTFRSWLIGSQITNLPVIWVAPVRLTPIVDMLLGADWLAGRHVWISYATQQFFVAK